MEETENCEAKIDGKSNGARDDDRSKLRKSNGFRRASTANWTEEEDDILADAVKKHEGKSWKKIAKCLPGRTEVQCLHRWQKVLNPDLIKGPWKKEEDILLIELVEKFGDGEKRWSKIAKELPGRIGKQCRERWYNHLKPEINKAAWTNEEEKILINAHAEYGNKWSMIAKLLPGRTENSVKNHWNCTIKRRHGNYASITTSRVDSWPNYSGLYYEPIDVSTTNVTNICSSSGRNLREPNGCGPSISYIKESSSDLFKRIKSMLRTKAMSFEKPSIVTRKRPLDKEASSSNTSMHDPENS